VCVRVCVRVTATCDFTQVFNCAAQRMLTIVRVPVATTGTHLLQVCAQEITLYTLVRKQGLCSHKSVSTHRVSVRGVLFPLSYEVAAHYHRFITILLCAGSVSVYTT
jgi:hypothetical protein